MGEKYPSDWRNRRENALIRDEYQCRNCGSKGGPDGNATLHAHHVVPKSQGGTDEISNLATLCEDCHRKAHAEDDLRAVGAVSSIDDIVDPWRFFRRYTPYLAKMIHAIAIVSLVLAAVAGGTALMNVLFVSVSAGQEVLFKMFATVAELAWFVSSSPVVAIAVGVSTYALHLADRDRRTDVKWRIGDKNPGCRRTLIAALGLLSCAWIALYLSERLVAEPRFNTIFALVYAFLAIWFCHQFALDLHDKKLKPDGVRPWKWESLARCGVASALLLWADMVPPLSENYHLVALIPILVGVTYLRIGQIQPLYKKLKKTLVQFIGRHLVGETNSGNSNSKTATKSGQLQQENDD